MKKLLLTILFVFLGIVLYFSVTDNKNLESSIESVSIPLVSDDTVKKSLFSKYYKEAQKVVTEMSIEEKIGQLFLVRYNKDDVKTFNDYNPSGYILFAKDFENHTKESIKEELSFDQSISKYPLILGVDEEGGYVTRVSRYSAFRAERFKSPRDYYNEGGYELLEKIETEKAQLLTELGLNLNLAPVADVSTNPSDFIYTRAFGQSADKTAEYIKQMVKYANANNISSCLKHFPGYGNNEDTHTGIAIDNREYNNFIANDYLPFKAGIEEGVHCILVSHNIVKAIDENYPASLSKNVINELREKLNYTGIIITDDLAMGAVEGYVTDGKAATLAINAGNDMIITSDFITMYNELLSSYQKEEITEQTINKAVLRIIAWKYYNNLYS